MSTAESHLRRNKGSLERQAITATCFKYTTLANSTTHNPNTHQGSVLVNNVDDGGQLATIRAIVDEDNTSDLSTVLKGV